jgi:hypothetical protein
MPVADRTLDAKADTECLVVVPDGRIFISLESPSRIWALSEDWRTLYSFGLGDTLDAYLEPTGLEAFALDPLGRLVAIPEWPVFRSDTTFPVLRQTKESEGWEVAAKLPRRGSFKPVGADFDSKGRLYLLERVVSLLGFRSRIRRFDLSAKDLNEETLLTTKLGTYDNLEAISLWEGDSKGVRIVVLSDDNLWHLQRTELIEFLLTE